MYFIKEENIGFKHYSKEYSQKIVDWINDEEVNKYFSLYQPITIQSLDKVIDRFSTSSNEIGFIIELIDSKKPIGIIEIRDIDYVSRTCEIEFAIGEKSLWEKGYGTKAFKLLDKYLFNDLHMHRVYLHTMQNNIGMKKLALKFNYSVEGVHIDGIFKNGQYFNELVMAKVDIQRDAIDKNINKNLLE